MRKGRNYVQAGVVLGFLGLAAVGCRAKDPSFSAENLTARYRTGLSDAEDRGEVTQEFCRSYLDFSLNLLRRSRSALKEEGGGDTLVSPLSVLLALEMTRSGAGTDTLEQMNAVLYPGLAAEQGKEGLLAFSAKLPAAEQAKLYLADSVWFRAGDGFTPDETFLETGAREYGAEIFRAPFDEATCAGINRWVERETDGEIAAILDEIPEDALVYLVNALAFDAQWREVYETGQIHDRNFTREDGGTAVVPMMFSEENGFLSGEHVRGFVKPYESGYLFAALLPEEGVSLEEWLGGFTGEAFLEIVAERSDRDVLAGLPKFESGTRLELSEVLCGLGMPLAFDGLRADFFGMGSVEGDVRLCISRVLHASQIAVDERGTKAGAATAVEMVAGGAMEAEPETVILDRPFLYAVIEEETGLPVFIGTAEYLGEEAYGGREDH